jgi:hypothetical protein
VTPAVAMDATKDGGAMLRVEFPKGDYVSGAPSAAGSTPASSASPAASDTAPPATSSARTPAPPTPAPNGSGS